MVQADLTFRDPSGGNFSAPWLTPRFSFEKYWRIILIHGFRNSEPAAIESYEKFKSYFLTANSLYAEKFFYLVWPGDQLGWNLSRYFTDNSETAGEVGRALGRYLHQLALHEGEVCRFVIVAHSLGCRLAAEMMQELYRLNPTACKRFQLFLMAGAFPEQDLLDRAALGAGLGEAGYVANFYSPDDSVLQTWFPIG